MEIRITIMMRNISILMIWIRKMFKDSIFPKIASINKHFIFISIACRNSLGGKGGRYNLEICSASKM
jgi:hypothetical protein